MCNIKSRIMSLSGRIPLYNIPLTNAEGRFRTPSQRPFNLEDRAYLDCKPGYQPEAPFSKVIQNSKGHYVWDPPRIDCKPVKCPSPPPIPGGTVGGDTDYTYGRNILYICDNKLTLNYSIRNSFLCNEHGKWEPEIPSDLACVDRNLVPKLQDLPLTNEKGTFHISKNPPYDINDTARLKCERGYTDPSNRFFSVVKLERGQYVWDPPRLDCEPMRCPNPTNILHATVDNTDFTFGKSFKYVCDSKYQFSFPFPNHFVCGEGYWEPPIPNNIECIPIPCPDLTTNEHVLMVKSQGKFVGQSVTFECEKGYRWKSGNEFRVCKMDGTWSGRDLVCEPGSPGYFSSHFKIFNTILFVFFLVLVFIGLSMRSNTVTENIVIRVKEQIVT